MSVNSLVNSTWDSLEAGEKALRAAALTDGFPLKVRRTTKIGNRPENQVKLKVFQCEHSGAKRNSVSPQTTRKRSYKCCDCPYQLTMRLVKGLPSQSGSQSGSGLRPWALTIDNSTHNHDFVPLSAYPSVRKLTASQCEQVIAMHAAAVPPRSIISTLRMADKDFCATPADISNVIQAARRREDLAANACLKQLFDQVTQQSLNRRNIIISTIRSLLIEPVANKAKPRPSNRPLAESQDRSVIESVETQNSSQSQSQPQPPLPLPLPLPLQMPLPLPSPSQSQSTNAQLQSTNDQPQFTIGQSQFTIGQSPSNNVQPQSTNAQPQFINTQPQNVQPQFINAQPQFTIGQSPSTNAQPQDYRHRCSVCHVTGHNARTCRLRTGSVFENTMLIT